MRDGKGARLDQMVIERAGRPIAQIFEEEGEEAFRNYETRALESLRSHQWEGVADGPTGTLDLPVEGLDGIGKQSDETVLFALLGGECGVLVQRGIFEQRHSVRILIDFGFRYLAMPGLKECCHAETIARRASTVCTVLVRIAACDARSRFADF